MAIWQDKLKFTYTPDEIKEVTLYYYITSIGITDKTPTTFPQAIAFRVLQDLFAGEDMTRSRYYEQRYNNLLRIMKREDEKQSGVFSRLTMGSKQRQFNRLDDITIEV